MFDGLLKHLILVGKIKQVLKTPSTQTLSEYSHPDDPDFFDKGFTQKINIPTTELRGTEEKEICKVGVSGAVS